MKTPLICTAFAAAGVVLGYGYSGVSPLEPGAIEGPVATDLSPIEVVAEQVTALSDLGADPSAAARVYRHASPSNRAVTGPLERFERMLWRPPFDAMVGSTDWTMGAAVQRDDVAAVLVTAIGIGGDLKPFRFYLSRRPEEGGRWMTDAVVPLSPGRRRESRPPVAPEA